MGWEEKAAKAKKGHRPSLKNWERDGLAQTFPPYAEALLTSSQPYSSFKIDNDGGDGKGRRVVERTMSLEFVREALRSSGRSSIIQCQRNKNNSGNSHRRHGGGCCEDMYPVVLDANLTSPKEFHERYEAKCIPVVIRNIPYGGSTSNSNLQANNHDNGDLGDDVMEEEKKDCDSIVSQACNSQQSNGKEWPAVRRWKLDALSVDPQLSERPLKCGEDDDGYTIRMKLRHFLQYLRHNRDDSPLYIFEATFHENKYSK